MKMLKKIYSKIRHWCCKVGLCNLDSCGCDCHKDEPKKKKNSELNELEKLARRDRPPSQEEWLAAKERHKKNLKH